MRQREPRYTKLQRAVIAAFGTSLLLAGAVSLGFGKLFVHVTLGSPLGWVFAPFSLVVGTLFILLAVRMGKQA